MTFRTRLLITFLLAVLLPMVILALFIRNEMTARLAAQYERRVEALVSVIEEDLAQEGEAIATSLAVIRAAVVDDNHFRRAAVDRVQEERRYLLDYAGNAMRLAGLSMLQIQDADGRIISSGHFRNEYDRMEPELPKLLAANPEKVALIEARAPDEPFLALVRVETFEMGNRQFAIVAGVKIEERFLSRLAREEGLTVALVYPDGILTPGAGESRDRYEASAETSDPAVAAGQLNDRSSADAIVRELNVPFIDSENGLLARAQFRVTHGLGELRALRGSIDRWFLVAVAAAAVFAVILVSWLASRISRPIVELADKTSRIDLDRLDVEFESDRKDEIGVLSRLLGAMTDRLRASAVRIKDAERRATIGELARQVNHDIKNGLTPIRNVFEHLVQLLRHNPDQMTSVFNERQKTLASSISYLENLAENYARLYPRSESRPCDVNEIVRRIVTDLQGFDDVELRMELGDGIVVLGDPVALRRIFENLVHNAIDSLEGRRGSVTVSTKAFTRETGQMRAHITVADTGKGMSGEQVKKSFDDFYTTKDDGTGLGLSIVRRLVLDLDGTMHVESEVGKGSTFIVDLPAARRAVKE